MTKKMWLIIWSMYKMDYHAGFKNYVLKESLKTWEKTHDIVLTQKGWWKICRQYDSKLG